MVVAEDRNMVCGGCARNRDCSIEVQPTVVKRPGQNDHVGMNRGDEVSPWRQILSGEQYGRRCNREQ